jgi:hypothetical protein
MNTSSIGVQSSFGKICLLALTWSALANRHCLSWYTSFGRRLNASVVISFVFIVSSVNKPN